MTRLLLDLGNSRDKAAVFEGRVLRAMETHSPLEWSSLRKILHAWKPSVALVSRTGVARVELMHALENVLQLFEMGPEIRLPFDNRYKTPETLGNDRLAGLAGARLRAPEGPLLAVDTGTCITIDSLDGEDRYFGGSIAPGWRMRLQAMHTFTARLPLIEIEEAAAVPLIGTDTRASLLSGALNGTVSELQGMIRAYSEQMPGLTVYITGGDAAFFDRMLKSRIFAVPNLVLEGLNHILEHHVEH